MDMSQWPVEFVPIAISVNRTSMNLDILFETIEIARQPVIDVIGSPGSNAEVSEPPAVKDAYVIEIHDVFKHQGA
jgi:hypothetical protein